MDITGLLQLLIQGLSTTKPCERQLLIRFRTHEQYEQCSEVLHELEASRSELADIRKVPLIDGWVYPARTDFDSTLLSTAYDVIVEEDIYLSMHAVSQRPVNWERGIPWGVKHIKAPQAWSTTTGYRVHIGVIDTGADFHHPDLRHSLTRGINLIQRGLPPHDDNGHGTHIAGTIAAANQMYGIIGVAPRAIIHPVKAFDENGAAFVSDIIQGIDWCVRHGMNIINMSFGMKTRSKSLLTAVTNAYNAGVTVVASSGNDAKRKSIDYPARYLQTISVGATDRIRKIASFSNRGRYVDIYAPGDKIVSAWIKGKYHEMSGTSMATSHVSGAIALLLAMKPGLKPGEIKTLLRRSASPMRSRNTTSRSLGEIDVMRLLKEAER
ncbi:S8 family peptidase [Paenibacillus sp. MER 180]|uniref:S8 family peptidase n=1 Tax=Paenibacillus sp. MER 180 TaxID=2939570 RepID=UPI00203DD100|nr:S8 family peptidase [Paenibacillus sp. MER 180]MCM3293593.1 S8 family peptidase [Paenibacillus sp. MER 180]